MITMKNVSPSLWHMAAERIDMARAGFTRVIGPV